MGAEVFSLELAGFSQSVAVATAELDALHRPVLGIMGELAGAAPRGRCVAFVAGVPGGGKTLLAALWAEIGRRDGFPLPLTVLPMDGFHLPNKVLEERAIERAGSRVTLRSIKGAPETYAVESMARRLETIARGERCFWPLYCRRLHEPVEEGILVGEGPAVLVIEGNYLLLDQEPWGGLGAFADLRCFIDAASEEVAEGILERHRRGGREREDALAHFRRTDLPNIELVRARRLPADLVLGRRGREAPNAPGAPGSFCLRAAAPRWKQRFPPAAWCVTL